MNKQGANTEGSLLGWHEATPVSQDAPRLLATLKAPRRNGAIVTGVGAW